MKRVAVIGAGVSGLSAALTLKRAHPEWQIQIFDANARAGGLIETGQSGAFCIEYGPDAMICDSEQTQAWIDKLGLKSRMINTRAENRGAYILSRGKLIRIPQGVSVLGTSRIDQLLRGDLLSKRGKLRVALEPFVRKSAPPDESIGAFVERRYGRQFLDRVAAPMVRGIYGGDAHSLSLRANLPRFAELEKQYGSVTRGLRAREEADSNEKGQGARYGAFVSFIDGMGELPQAFLKELQQELRLARRVLKVEKADQEWRVQFESEAQNFDALVLATSAAQSAKLLHSADAALSTLLGATRSGPAAIATFAWPKANVQHALDAFGFVVAPTEKSSVAACTWSSIKWRGRAPDTHLLLRAFINDELLTQDMHDDEALLRNVEIELRALLGINVVPELRMMKRWDAIMPRYAVGHLQWLEDVRARLASHPTLALAGNSYTGVGIPAALTSGKLAAEEVIVALATTTREM